MGNTGISRGTGNMKPPHTDLYRLAVAYVMSAPVDGRKLTFGTSCRCERVKIGSGNGDFL